jgi:hypothetical protein
MNRPIGRISVSGGRRLLTDTRRRPHHGGNRCLAVVASSCRCHPHIWRSAKGRGWSDLARLGVLLILELVWPRSGLAAQPSAQLEQLSAPRPWRSRLLAWLDRLGLDAPDIPGWLLWIRAGASRPPLARPQPDEYRADREHIGFGRQFRCRRRQPEQPAKLLSAYASAPLLGLAIARGCESLRQAEDTSSTRNCPVGCGFPVPSGRGRHWRSGPPRPGTDRPAGHGKADASLNQPTYRSRKPGRPGFYLGVRESLPWPLWCCPWLSAGHRQGLL